MSVYSKTSLMRKDLTKKGMLHLSKKFKDPAQIPVFQPDEEDEGPRVKAMRNIKVREFER